MTNRFANSPRRTALKAVCCWVLAIGLLGSGALLAPVQATSYSVQIHNYSYGPSALSVKVGDTVTWTNHDSVGHDVVVTNGPASFKSPMLAKGQSWSYTFTKPGSYRYICSVHPDMTGSVSVAAVAPAATSAPSPAAPQAAQSGGAAAAPDASASPTAEPSPSATPKASAKPAAAAVAQESPEEFSPLLLAAGAILAILVFCLLLIASRPDGLEPASVKAAEEGGD